MTTKAAARNEADGYLASHRITFVPQSKDMKTGDGTRTGYTTISARGLDWDSVPMRLFQKAKKLGTWDPQALDFSRDRRLAELRRPGARLPPPHAESLPGRRGGRDQRPAAADHGRGR